MPQNNLKYLVDSDVLIQAHKRHYAFNLCPGFWNCLGHHHQNSRIISIDKVRGEIAQGDELYQWANNTVDAGFWGSTADQQVITEFTRIMQWVSANTQFKPHYIAEFAAGADGWLIAFAKVNGYVVCTHEAHAQTNTTKVKIPNVCVQFGVPVVDSFAMLKDLATQFHWNAP